MSADDDKIHAKRNMINLTLLNLFWIKRLRRKHMQVNAYENANLVTFI